MRKTTKTTEPAKPQGPFYVLEDDAAELGFDNDGEMQYGYKFYIARQGEGECGYSSSTDYNEIASEVDFMNEEYAAGRIQ